MKTISYLVTIRVLSPHVQSTLSQEEFCENEQFPFDRLCVEIKETYHCPFCKNGVEMFHCNCTKFSENFAKLQESVHDTNHKTVLHLHPYENFFGQGKKAINISVKPLTAQEVAEFGPDFWDDAQKVVDMKTKRSFYVVNPTYKKGEIAFIYKDLQTKEVYSCSLKGYYYKHHKIYLGVFYDEYVCRGDSSLIGNYSKEPRCKDFAIFDNWDTLCKKLKTIWKLIKDTLFECLFS